LVEAAPSAIGLGWSGGDGREPGSTARTLETVEATYVATSARDAGRVDVEETRNMVETPHDAEREGEVLLELWTKWGEPPQLPP
jgi:hypothetical protein